MSMTLLTCSFCTGHCSWQDQQVVQAQSSSSPMTSPIMLGGSAAAVALPAAPAAVAARSSPCG